MNNKNKVKKIKKFSPEGFVRHLLRESGFPERKPFTVKRRDGVLEVRFNKKHEH